MPGAPPRPTPTLLAGGRAAVMPQPQSRPNILDSPRLYIRASKPATPLRPASVATLRCSPPAHAHRPPTSFPGRGVARRRMAPCAAARAAITFAGGNPSPAPFSLAAFWPRAPPPPTTPLHALTRRGLWPASGRAPDHIQDASSKSSPRAVHEAHGTNQQQQQHDTVEQNCDENV